MPWHLSANQLATSLGNHHFPGRQILQRNRGAFLTKNRVESWRYPAQLFAFYNGGQYDSKFPSGTL